MSNLKLYKKSFVKGLEINEGIDLENLKYNDIPEWDSIGHMSLISELEQNFNLTFDTDDIVNFSSFSEGKKILAKLKIDL